MTTRVIAGQTVSLTFTPASTSGEFKAFAIDAAGRYMRASAEVSGSDVIVTVSEAEWHDGRPGIGRVQLRQTNGNVVTYATEKRLRILPGIDAYHPWLIYHGDYGLAL